ncbi:MAG: class II aldolase/adducin family protein [Oscillospiraceae bacterium]|jgi:L-fuculose-phosphate aldolase|nr:class II aldolase/adducin family protein [Oscillospiraceae bacterium]
MDILQAKLAVIAAGKRLLETGLIARTWGNVSCRVNETQFVITPSGRAYENLTPEEIVLVSAADLSYEGGIKPSSEKGIHAQAYLLRPEVNFVVHTHQHNASIVSVMGREISGVNAKQAALLGTTIPLAGYGLPGTGKLRKGVTAALRQHPGSKAILMAHHGALCMGKDAEEAFQVADTLEQACAKFLSQKLLEVTGEIAETVSGIHKLLAAKRAQRQRRISAPPLQACTSFRSGDAAFCITPGDKGETLDVSLKSGKVLNGAEEYPEALELHRAIYLKDKKTNAIIHSKKADILHASASGAKRLKPFLDDFAQIAGVNLRLAQFDPANQLESANAAQKLLRRRSALLLADNGALCTGKDLEEARAVELVTEKNCAVSLSADLFKQVRAIGAIDAALMRLIYVKKYSKQKTKKQ